MMRTVWVGYLIVTVALFVTVWFDLNAIKGMDAWGAFGMCLVVLAGMPFVSKWVRAMAVQEYIYLSAQRLHRFSCALGGGILDYGDIAALTVARDKKSKFWVFRNASKPRRAVRVHIGAYPELDDQLRTIKDWMAERRAGTRCPTRKE